MYCVFVLQKKKRRYALLRSVWLRDEACLPAGRDEG
jgi:hypothetical protein